MTRHQAIPIAGLFLAVAASLSLTTHAFAKEGTAEVPLAEAWKTAYEKSGFLETPRYQETIDYLKRLEKGSPWIRVSSFGKSGEGRDLVLVVASSDRAFDPAAAKKTGKAILLLQAGIHAGEIDGKDAGMMLLRDMAITKTRAALLDGAILLFMPMYNVDGHERFGPYNRTNQNGPREMGWRTTARNLNLNRDYLKADAPETRAWLKVYTTWWPDLLLDAHVTDGADYRPVMTYGVETGPNVPKPVADWAKRAVEGRAVPAIEAGGTLISPYIQLVDDTDPAAGMIAGAATPRFSTGYTVLQNRPAFLLETHMLKGYKSRVDATYATVAALLEECGRDRKALREAIRSAEEAASRPGRTPLAFRTTEETRPVTLRGVSYTREPSALSGAMRVRYGKEPLDLTVPLRDRVEATLEVERPRAYLVPPQWTDEIAVLKAHGLRLQRLTSPLSTPVEGYRLSDPKWQEAPFEGRHPVTCKAERLESVPRVFPAGTVVVPMDQPGSAVAVHLLEPLGPDSFVSWGFFDAVFEQKEFAEAYVVEELARAMMEKDPALQAEFEKALADPAFAADPRKRLDFFFRRSPYWENPGLYPIGLVTDPSLKLATRPD
ncbi:MAG TPA: M14 family metallopeptidase [Candidatus Polarisedimenticolia bacterium]|nr:M14 family metallopeptidase [Candidatus Polarisedimenticolia bacterium]